MSTSNRVAFLQRGLYPVGMKRREMLAWDKLRPLREAAGLSLDEVAAVVGKDKGWLSRLERGAMKRDVAEWIVVGLAEKLGATRDDLMVPWPESTVVRDHLGDLAPRFPDAALLAALGFEPVADDELRATVEEFAASALRGRGNLIPQNYDEMRPKRPARKKRPPPHVFKVRISGDCMRDTVRDGEVVYFDTELPKEPVALVLAIRDDHEAHVKRLVRRDGVLWLESDDGWATPVDDRWRIAAVGFAAQRLLPMG